MIMNPMHTRTCCPDLLLAHFFKLNDFVVMLRSSHMKPPIMPLDWNVDSNPVCKMLCICVT